MSASGAQLRKLLDGPEPTVMPGVNSALAARIVEAAGFDAVHVSGYALTGSVLAEPDVGRLSLPEIVAFCNPVRRAVSMPVMVDGETGFGHLLNTYRAVRELNELGFAGIQIDDLDAEVCPYIGQEIKLVGIETMERRIRSVIEARGDEDFIVEATTTCEDDTRIERIVRYAEAGADVIAAVWRSEEQLRATAEAIRGTKARLVAVCFPLLPYLTWEQFAEIGIALIKYPVELMYAGALAQVKLLQHLKAETTLEARRDQLLDHEAYLELVGNAGAASLISHLNRPYEGAKGGAR